MTVTWIMTLLGVALVSLVSLIGIIAMPRNKAKAQKITHFLISMAAGAMLGNAFIHLLPESFEEMAAEKVSLLVLSGIFVCFSIEKLFNIIQPNKSFFGEKDFQQLAVIKNMVSDLDLPVEIIPVTTAREKNGLAISSRNVYLDETQRKLAPKIYETLCLVRDKIINKELSVQDALSLGKKELATDFIVQYLEACTLDNLEPIQSNDKPFTILVAAKLGNVRLIDNLIVK